MQWASNIKMKQEIIVLTSKLLIAWVGTTLIKVKITSKFSNGKLEVQQVFSAWLGPNPSHGGSCPSHVWPALLSPVSSCFPVAADPQAAQADSFSNLSNHLNLTLERSRAVVSCLYYLHLMCSSHHPVVRAFWNV